MSAYLIFTRERTIDQAEMDIYSSLAPATAASHPIDVLANYGRFEVLEGDPIEGSFVMRFPTYAAAKTFYNSHDYQAVAVHRHAGSDYRVFIVEGGRLISLAVEVPLRPPVPPDPETSS